MTLTSSKTSRAPRRLRALNPLLGGVQCWVCHRAQLPALRPSVLLPPRFPGHKPQRHAVPAQTTCDAGLHADKGFLGADERLCLPLVHRPADAARGQLRMARNGTNRKAGSGA